MRLNKKSLLFSLLGLFFLGCFAVWPRSLAPQFLKLPKDFSFTATVISVDNFYNEERSEFAGAQYSKTNYSYTTIAATDETLVVKNIFDVRTPDDQPIFSVERQYGIDRTTGAHVDGLGDQNRAGYVFAPRHLRKGDAFTYWHINYDGPAHMTFVGEEELYGVPTYRYHSAYAGVNIDQTKDLTSLPGVGATRGVELEPTLDLWVEPTTGRLVKYADDTVAYYYDLLTDQRLTPWNHFSNSLSEESVSANVRAALVEKTRAKVIELYIPLVFFALALWFLSAAGGVWVRLQNSTLLAVGRALPAWIMVVISLVFIGRWAFGVDDLVRVFSTEQNMNPLVAGGFFLLGLSFLLNKLTRGRFPAIIGGLCIIVGGLQLLWNYGLIPVAPDTVFFHDAVVAAHSRMSLFAAFSFFILGWGLLSTTRVTFRRFRVLEIVSITIFILSLLAVVGYLFQSSGILAYTIFISTSPQTVLGMLLVSVTTFFTYRERSAIRLSFGNSTLVVSTLFGLVLATVAVTGFVERSFAHDAQQQFTAEADRATNAIFERFNNNLDVLRGALGLLTASEVVTRAEWRTYVSALEVQKNYPGILGISYAAVVQQAERDAHVARIRAEGLSTYAIHPPGERVLYNPIIYIEPFDERNQVALGFDIYQDKVRRLAIDQARDTGEPKLTGRITLVQDESTTLEPGFLVVVPFYANGAPHATREQKRRSIVGYITGPFRARDFVQSVIGMHGLENITLRINDGTTMTPESELFTSLSVGATSGATPRFTTNKTLYLAGRPWNLQFASSSGYGQTQFFRLLPLAIVIIGIGISILLTLMLYTLISSRQRALAYADTVTTDLRLAKAKDEAMLLSIGDGLVATDNVGIVTRVNPAFEQMLGWQESEIQGQQLVQLVPMFSMSKQLLPKSQRPLYKAFQENIPGTTITTAYYQRKDGSTFPVVVTASPILEGTHVIGAVEVFRDITKELQVDKAKTEFVTIASHQLRTPLTTVRWYVEMLLKGDAGTPTVSQKKYLQEVYNSSQRMVELVNALLNVSRIDLGTFAIEPAPTKIADVARIALQDLQPQIRKKHLALTQEIAPGIPVLPLDPTLTLIIFQNLLSNAVKYTPENGAITLRISWHATGLTIEVEDTGYGIAQRDYSKIFQKLFRTDTTRYKDPNGTGLGLYIVKSIVDRIGGNISFTSQLGKGTTFRVVLSGEGMQPKAGTKGLSV